jgi:hypothetical protein
LQSYNKPIIAYQGGAVNVALAIIVGKAAHPQPFRDNK